MMAPHGIECYLLTNNLKFLQDPRLLMLLKNTTGLQTCIVRSQELVDILQAELLTRNLVFPFSQRVPLQLSSHAIQNWYES